MPRGEVNEVYLPFLSTKKGLGVNLHRGFGRPTSKFQGQTYVSMHTKEDASHLDTTQSKDTGLFVLKIHKNFVSTNTADFKFIAIAG
jgi:hypothetical protein